MSEQTEIAAFDAALTAWRFTSLYGTYKRKGSALGHRIIAKHENEVQELRRALVRIALFGKEKA